MLGGVPPLDESLPEPLELSAKPLPSKATLDEELPELSAFVTKIPFDPFEFVVIFTFEISKLPFVLTKIAELIP